MGLTTRLLVATHSTTDGTSFTTGAFTPNEGERLYVLFGSSTASMSGFTYTCNDSQKLGSTETGWTVRVAAGNTGRFPQIWESTYTATDRSMTVTVTSSTLLNGASVVVLGVTGWPVFVQSGQGTWTGGATPTITFGASVSSTSTVIGLASNAQNPTTILPPTGFTALNDSGYATPNTGLQTIARDGGFTGTTVTFGSTSASSGATVALELREGLITDMSHFVTTGADATYNVARIRYPSADPDNRTSGMTSVPYIYNCPASQWDDSSDYPNANSVPEHARTLGAGYVYIFYHPRSSGSAYPTQITDIHTGIQWVIANAATYKLDTTRAGAFGLSAAAHLMATAALTGGVAAVGGGTTPSGHIRHVLWHFGHNGRSRMFSPAWTATGVTPGRTLPCNAGPPWSSEAEMLGGSGTPIQPCSQATFDWLSGDSGSLSTATSSVYNQFSPSFWAGQWSSGTKPSFELWHGELDAQIPYFSTHNPQTTGTGHALDNGFHEDLVANGFVSSYNIEIGATHGGGPFLPSSNPSSTNGADVDASIVRLLDAMGAGGDSQQDRRRRGYSLLFHNHGLPNRRSV